MPVLRKLKQIDGAGILPFAGDCSAFPRQDKTGYVKLPGFCDVHVHLREPGFSYKESIRSGSLAAARGGYTAVCAMPNLNPVPDSVEHLEEELAIIRRDAVIDVRAYGAISVNEAGKALADLEGMAPYVIAFSDDGHGVQDPGMMREAMERARDLGKLIVAHCEDNTLLRSGYIHDGAYAAAHGHRGICSESEWRQVARDLELAAQTGCGYHVCHISTKESLRLIREARRDGLDVSCETAPHYLLLDENHLQEDGRFKMNPPLRAREDREALLDGLCSGDILCIATDHAPHSAEEKNRGLERSAFGIVGLETAFPLLYTELVKTGVLTLEALVALLSDRPRERFGLPLGDDWSLWDLECEYTIDPADFLSKGKASPFTGRRVFGKCLQTVFEGRTVYEGE